MSDRGFPPTVGLLDSLPDGIRTSSDASEIQCLGVTSPLMKKVYENSPVRAVAYYSWDNWDLGLSGHFMVRAGAVALTSPPDARALFDTFVKQWKQCQGTTMVLYQAGGGADRLHEMTNIRATDTMLSAIVMSSSPATHTAASPDERALGIAMNCIVDVEVSDSSWRTGDPMPENRAVKIAEAMLERISTTGQPVQSDNYADAPGGPVQMPPCALSGVQPGGPAGATRQLSGFFGEYTTGMSSPILGQLSTSTANR